MFTPTSKVGPFKMDFRIPGRVDYHIPIIWIRDKGSPVFFFFFFFFFCLRLCVVWEEGSLVFFCFVEKDTSTSTGGGAERGNKS